MSAHSYAIRYCTLFDIYRNKHDSGKNDCPKHTLQCRIKETIKLSSALFVLSAAVTINHQPQATYPCQGISLPLVQHAFIKLCTQSSDSIGGFPSETEELKIAMFAQTLAESTAAHRKNGTAEWQGVCRRRRSGEEVPGLKRKPLAGKSRKSSQQQKPFKAWREQELMPMSTPNAKA